jgi:DNA-binding CsgD family transcriptional regulator
VQISEHKEEIVVNLYISGIPEEFIALQLDLDIPTVISILKEKHAYQKV